MKNSITQSLNHSITPARLRAGLTFVELLLAVAVFAILMTGLSSHLRGSVVVWRRVTSTTEHLQRIRVMCDRLRSELAQAVVFDSTGIAWKPGHDFKHERLAFYSVRPGQAVDKPGEAIFVTYEWDQKKKMLVRTVQTPQQAHAVPPVEGILEQLLDQVEGFAIRYRTLPQGKTQMEWRDSWTDPKTLPKLLEVTVKLGENADIPGPIRQMVMIPTGTLTQP